MSGASPPPSGTPNDGLPHSGSFGEGDEYWDRYLKLANKQDHDMMRSLNSNLDVLLIFAGLFSSVNTGFIAITMATLSPNPIDHTNQLLTLLLIHRTDNVTIPLEALSRTLTGSSTQPIRTNILLLLSLSCSILAAAGAMLGKQWLQNYENAGRLGPPEVQGRQRQRKYDGAVSWFLRPILDMLPALLLTSLVFFFAGLADYLWSLSVKVGSAVLIFAAIATNFLIFTIIAAAIYPQCPFQTGISSYLRTGYLAIERFVDVRIRRRGSRSDKAEEMELEEVYVEMDNAQSVSWMLLSSTEQEERMLVAKNIPLLLRVEACRMIFFSHSYSRLYFNFKAILSNSIADNKVDSEALVFYTSAICHIISTVPLSSARKRYPTQIPDALWLSKQPNPDLKLLSFSFLATKELQMEWLKECVESITLAQPTTVMLFLKALSSNSASHLAIPGVITALGRLCDGMAPFGKPFLSSVSLAMSSLFLRPIRWHVKSRRVSDSWDAYRGVNLEENLEEALSTYNWARKTMGTPTASNAGLQRVYCLLVKSYEDIRRSSTISVSSRFSPVDTLCLCLSDVTIDIRIFSPDPSTPDPTGSPIQELRQMQEALLLALDASCSPITSIGMGEILIRGILEVEASGVGETAMQAIIRLVGRYTPRIREDRATRNTIGPTMIGLLIRNLSSPWRSVAAQALRVLASIIDSWPGPIRGNLLLSSGTLLPALAFYLRHWVNETTSEDEFDLYHLVLCLMSSLEDQTRLAELLGQGIVSARKISSEERVVDAVRIFLRIWFVEKVHGDGYSSAIWLTDSLLNNIAAYVDLISSAHAADLDLLSRYVTEAIVIRPAACTRIQLEEKQAQLRQRNLDNLMQRSYPLFPERQEKEQDSAGGLKIVEGTG